MTERLLVALAMVASAAPPSAPSSPRPLVEWQGSLRAAHGGDTSPKLALSSVEGRRHLYAVGPVAHSDGEITVLDSQAWVARVAAGELAAARDFRAAAVFLVWAQVENWSPPATFYRTIASHAELEAAVEVAAHRASIDTSTPFPFLLKGRFTRVDIHVQAPAGPDSPAGGHSRKMTFRDANGTALGFYAKKHEGIFTHRGSFAHLHDVGAGVHGAQFQAGPRAAG